MKHVYLAGPITGLEFDEAKDWRDDFIAELKRHGWNGLSPMRDKEEFRIKGKLSAFFDEGAAAVDRDLRDIEKSEAVIINFRDAQAVSLGSSAEMGYAYALGRPIIVVVEGDPGEWNNRPEQANPHHHVFTEYMATVIVDSLDNALKALESIHKATVINKVPYVPPLGKEPSWATT